MDIEIEEAPKQTQQAEQSVEPEKEPIETSDDQEQVTQSAEDEVAAFLKNAAEGEPDSDEDQEADETSEEPAAEEPKKKGETSSEEKTESEVVTSSPELITTAIRAGFTLEEAQSIPPATLASMVSRMQPVVEGKPAGKAQESEKETGDDFPEPPEDLDPSVSEYLKKVNEAHEKQIKALQEQNERAAQTAAAREQAQMREQIDSLLKEEKTYADVLKNASSKAARGTIENQTYGKVVTQMSILNNAYAQAGQQATLSQLFNQSLMLLYGPRSSEAQELKAKLREDESTHLQKPTSRTTKTEDEDHSPEKAAEDAVAKKLASFGARSQ